MICYCAGIRSCVMLDVDSEWEQCISGTYEKRLRAKHRSIINSILIILFNILSTDAAGAVLKTHFEDVRASSTGYKRLPAASRKSSRGGLFLSQSSAHKWRHSARKRMAVTIEDRIAFFVIGWCNYPWFTHLWLLQRNPAG